MAPGFGPTFLAVVLVAFTGLRFLSALGALGRDFSSFMSGRFVGVNWSGGFAFGRGGAVTFRLVFG